MRFLPTLALLFGLLSLAAIHAESKKIAPSVDDRMMNDLKFLASKECEGRGVSTKGITKAGDYIVDTFKQLGLKPGNEDGYLQQVTIKGAVLKGPNKLVIAGPKGEKIECAIGKEFQPCGMSNSGEAKAQLVFVGYGAIADKNIKYNDFDGIDVEDKIIVVLRDAPHSKDKDRSFDRTQRMRAASFTKKLENAGKFKAAGVLFVNDQELAEKDDLVQFEFLAVAPSESKLPAAHLKRDLLDRMLKSSADTSLKDVEAKINKEMKPQSVELKGWLADLEINVDRSGIPSRNVVAVLEGKGKLADETVVIGAHYDHLGYGGVSSLAGPKKQAIHHGADDNASGTTGLLEIARRLSKDNSKDRRRVVFIAFTGEELGLLGSAHYVKNPLFPIDKTVAMINMDMIGRLRRDNREIWSSLLAVATPGFNPGIEAAAIKLGGLSHLMSPKDKLIVYGTGTARTFDDLIEDLNKKYEFKLRKIKGGHGPSDHASFYEAKVPVLFFFTGEHEDYHQPSDTVDKINFTGMKQIIDMISEAAHHLITMPEKPEYVHVPPPKGMHLGGKIPRIGFMPGYNDDGPGVLMQKISKDGAGEKAGLKNGDRILAVAGKEVKNVEEYFVTISEHKPGKPLELTIQRDGKKFNVTVTPE